jgi:CheY-like chemotaxis protein
MCSNRPLILIGERDPFMRNALAQVLAPGYELVFASTGSQLIDLARRDPPDLIIVEALLPVIDGFQVCMDLRRFPETRQIPILFFTSLMAEERAIRAGASAFLLKPLQPAILQERIRELLSVGQARYEGRTNGADCHRDS